MEALILYFVGIALTFYMAWCLGANDAANPTDCAVGSGVISLKRAVQLFVTFAIIGTMLQGFMVMKTIDRGIVSKIEILGAFTSVLAACIWITLCTWKGMPISTTHSIIGAVLGYGLAAYGIGGIRWGVFQKVIISMAASPILSLLLAAGIYRALTSLLPKVTRSLDRMVRWLLIGSLCFSAYAFGANDVGNATGVYVTVTKELGGITHLSAMLMLAALGGLGIALGGFTWGYRVIDTGARRVTRLNPTMGLSAELSNALTVYLFTTIPFILFGWGIPISTTHSSIGAIIGVGLARRGAVGIDRRTVVKVVAMWCLTIPAVAAMSIALYWAVLRL